jgi:hypothetical protein
MTTNKQYIPPEVLRLMELGRQKKLWALEIEYTVRPDNEIKLQYKRNLTGEELKIFRDALFRYGLSIPIKPGHWRIICPMDIIQVDCFQQDCYIMESYRMMWEEPDRG